MQTLSIILHFSGLVYSGRWEMDARDKTIINEGKTITNGK